MSLMTGHACQISLMTGYVCQMSLMTGHVCQMSLMTGRVSNVINDRTCVSDVLTTNGQSDILNTFILRVPQPIFLGGHI